MDTVGNNFGVKIFEEFDTLKQASEKQLKQIVSMEKSVACMKSKQEYLTNGIVSITDVVKAELKRRDKTISDNNKIISDLKRELDLLKCNSDLKRKADEEQENDEQKRMKFNDNNENRLPRVYNKNRGFYNRGYYSDKSERSSSRENYRVASRYWDRKTGSKAPKESDNREHRENKFKDDEKNRNVEEPYRVVTESYGGIDKQISREGHHSLSKILTNPSNNGTSRYRIQTKKLKFVEKLQKDYEQKWSTSEGKDKYRSRSSFDSSNHIESCINGSKSESYENRFDKQSEPEQTESKEHSRLGKKITRNSSFEEGEIRSDDEVYSGGFRHGKSFQDVKRIKRARSNSCYEMRCDDIEELTNANSCSDKPEPDKMCTTKSISFSEYKNRMDSNKLNKLNKDTFEGTQTETKNPSEDTLSRIQKKENKIVVLSDIKVIPCKSKAGHTKKKYENHLRTLADTAVKQSEEYSGDIKDENQQASLDKEETTEPAEHLHEKLELESTGSVVDGSMKDPSIKSDQKAVRRSTRSRKEVQRLDVSAERTRRRSSKEDSRDKVEQYTAATESINAVPASSSTPQYQSSSENPTTEVQRLDVSAERTRRRSSKEDSRDKLEQYTAATESINAVPAGSSTPQHQSLSENPTADVKERRRITPIPVKEKSQCTFTNILEKTSSTFTVHNTFQLTHDGEIPILHIEDNLSNLNEDGKTGDNSILKLLDTMNMSNTECDSTKLKSCDVVNLNNPLSFENLMNKVALSPLSANSEQNGGQKDNQNITGQNKEDSLRGAVEVDTEVSYEQKYNKEGKLPINPELYTDAANFGQNGYQKVDESLQSQIKENKLQDVGTDDCQNVPSIPLNISEKEPLSFESFMNNVTSTPVALRQNEAGTDTDMQITNEKNLCRTKLETVTGQTEIVMTEDNVDTPNINLISQTTNDQLCSKDLDKIESIPVTIASNPHEIGVDNANLLTNEISRINTDANTELNQNESNTSKGVPVMQSTNLSTVSNNSTWRRKRNRVVCVVVIE